MLEWTAATYVGGDVGHEVEGLYGGGIDGWCRVVMGLDGMLGWYGTPKKINGKVFHP